MDSNKLTDFYLDLEEPLGLGIYDILIIMFLVFKKNLHKCQAYVINL